VFENARVRWCILLGVWLCAPVPGRLTGNVSGPGLWCADPFLVHPCGRLANTLKPANPEAVAADTDESRATDDGQVRPTVRSGLQCNHRQVRRSQSVACELASQHAARVRLAASDLDATVMGEFDAGPHGCMYVQYSRP
jgi:hypothetical protein